MTFLMESLQSLLSAGGAADFEAVLHPHQLFAQVLGRRLFVVNDQYQRLGVSALDGSGPGVILYRHGGCKQVGAYEVDVPRLGVAAVDNPILQQVNDLIEGKLAANDDSQAAATIADLLK